MMGQEKFRWVCVASAAIVPVTSPPMMSKQTWFTISGITGLTFPGMIDEPGCIGGRLISPTPPRRPPVGERGSVAIFGRFTPQRFRIPDNRTHAPVSGLALTRLGA